MPPTITVVVPTIGRPTLAAAIISVLYQLSPLDEILIIGDGHQPLGALFCQQLNLIRPVGIIRYIDGPVSPPTWPGGSIQKEFGISQATADYTMILNDDDRIPAGTISRVKRTAARHPQQVLAGELLCLRDGFIVQKCTEIREGYISDVQLIVPNDSTKRGKYLRDDIRDIHYVTSVLAHYADEIIWLDAITYEWDAYSPRNPTLPIWKEHTIDNGCTIR
jgi:hypothetical protein